MNTDAEPRVTITIDQKINLGNYESASVGIILSSVRVGVTNEELDEMLQTGRLMYDRMRESLRDKVALKRKEGP